MAIYGYLWLFFTVAWLVAAVGSKPVERREGRRTRATYGLFILAGCLLLIRPAVLGSLDVPFIPNTRLVWNLGLILTAVGIAIAIWARFALGRNWSGTVTIKQNHELIQNGPYRLVRHPIYSGILLAMLGTAIGFGRVPCLIGLVIVFFALRFKWGTEERLMTEQFGAKYDQYRREVKAVIPGIL